MNENLLSENVDAQNMNIDFACQTTAVYCLLAFEVYTNRMEKQRNNYMTVYRHIQLL